MIANFGVLKEKIIGLKNYSKNLLNPDYRKRWRDGYFRYPVQHLKS